MALESLYEQYRADGYAGVRDAQPSEALEQFYVALLAFGEDRFADALAAARRAADLEADNLVYTHAVTYLQRVLDQGKAGVYVDGEAFAAFIRGGGNVGLYAAASSALKAVYGQYEALSLLDVGVGDGLALLPALTDAVTHLGLVEPSEAMLARTCAALEKRGIAYHAANTTIQHYIQAGASTWDVIQATWSLQSLPPAERPPVFAWMRQHGARLLIAEFDVPDFADLFAPERARYIVAHYENGLAEYADDGGLVAQGFLMPVLFGCFDRSAARTNYEGPIQGWIDDLRAAGFTTVDKRLLFRYFWADSYLIDAR
ncbi:MAG: class I SAM-dependent methyltransferase [Anaerolineae bacterium]|nr:class I SAM-dependent methyltransferase [Anaerolineae bacterium]